MADKPSNTTVSVTKFGGLRLDVDPADVGWGEAIDVSNLVLDREGQAHTREALDELNALDGTLESTELGIFETSAKKTYVIVRLAAGPSMKLEGYSVSSTTLIDSVTQDISSSQAMSGATLGDDTGTGAFYFVSGDGVLRKWDGTSFTTIATAPSTSIELVTLFPRSNRLVLQDRAGNDSRLSFSDQGDPETYSDVTLDLTPGDGSGIVGMATFQDYVFVFKRDRHFVLTTESEDQDGNPFFNYFTVDGFGSTGKPVVGKHGVYFFDGHDVWVTNGTDLPKRVSDHVGPFLRGEVSLGGISLVSTNVPQPRLHYALGRLYLRITNSTNSTGFWLVYDEQAKAWGMYTAYSGTMTVAGAGELHETDGTVYSLFIMSSGSGSNSVRICKFGINGTPSQDGDTDDVDWYYQTGYVAPADPHRTTVRESIVWGTGSANLQLLTRGARTGDTADTGDDLTLGSSDPAPARRRKTVRGVRFSMKLSGTGATTISSVSHTFSTPSTDRP